jgi:antitoxin component YwqK of YwqJK toxin-antitoxin module
VWYENGSLKIEGDVSRGFHKKYFTNGKLGQEVSGKFHFDDDGEVILENASEKEWYENGILGFETKFPKYRKVYFPDGILLAEEEGTLYYDEQKEIQIQDGTRKTYYHDNGKLSQKIIYKKISIFYKNLNIFIS